MNLINELFINAFIICATLSVVCFYFWTKTNKAFLVYAHLAFLFAPALILLRDISCEMNLLDGLIAFCSAVISKAMIYLIPSSIILSFIIGYFIIPKLYIKGLKAKHIKNSFITNYSKNIKLFAINKAKPLAFSIKNTIFVSVGLFDILTKKELNAVLLHEIYHVLNKSSLNKFSTFLARFFSPIAAFHAKKALSFEENKADAFAIKIQKTKKHLNSAKQKIKEYYKN